MTSNLLALDNQLVSRFQFVDDLHRCVVGSCHAGVSGPVWPDDDSQSPRTDSRGPRRIDMEAAKEFGLSLGNGLYYMI
jgi:hypothetical protein